MDHKNATIVRNILASKKYHSIYKPTVERIVEHISPKSSLNTEEKTRTILHQIWGAYYSLRPNFTKLEKKISERLKNGEDKEKIITDVLSLHSSTKERMPYQKRFFSEIFSYTGIPNSIIDHACGLNPLMIPWMYLSPSTTYQAYDIDIEEVMFLDKVVQTFDIIPKPVIKTGDILTDTFPYADIIFLFKLLPVLEMQQKNSARDILLKQQCKFLIVSFPVKSLGGKEKGMRDFYSEQFISEIKRLSWTYTKLPFPSELVFIIQRS